MSNWCSNKLTIIGNKDNLTMLKDILRGIDTDICLNNIVPMPMELNDTQSPGDKPNWYDWRMNNWGIKWDVEAHLVYESEQMLIYEFDSPWGPPDLWVKNVALMFPDLSFELYYKEPGMCFQGTISAQQDLFIDKIEDYYEEIDEFVDQDEYYEDDQDVITIIKRE